MKRDSLIFYRSFYEAIRELPSDQKAEVYDAIFSYALDFKEPKLSGISKTVFTLVKPQLSANIEKYKNGTKPKQKQSKTEANPKQNESKPEGNVNDNVNDSNKVDLTINWDALIRQFNDVTGKKTKVVSDGAKRQFKARLKEGYTKQDILNAIINCYEDDYHKQTNHKYLTYEFISRADKLDKYANIKPQQKPERDRTGML